MGFVAVSTLINTHFHVFHPPQLGTYTYPLARFSTPTPIGTPTFHLEHPPQVQTTVVGWNFKLSVLFGFSTLKLHFVDPNFSIPAPSLPQNQKHKTKLLPRYNELSSIKFDQNYQLEMLNTVTKTTRVEISTLS